MAWVLAGLLLEMAAGEHGPRGAKGQEAGAATGDEDVFVAKAKVERTAGIGEDIANGECRRGAVEFFVGFGPVGIKDRVAVGVRFLDIRGAEGIARLGFDVEAGTGAVEGMADAYEEGYEDEVGLVGGKIVEANLCGDLVTFVHGEVAVEEGAEAGSRMAFQDELGDL